MPRLLPGMFCLTVLGCCAEPAPPARLDPVQNEAPAPKTKKEVLRLAVLGDRTGHPDDKIFRTILRQIDRLAPDAVIGVGDLIQGYQADDKMDEARAEWDYVTGIIQRELGDTPLFAAAGNHDVWSPKSLELFERRMNPPNAVFDFGPAAVIFFDTSRVNFEQDIPDKELDWLVSMLYAARNKKTRIVVTHRPLFAQQDGGRYGSPLHDVLIAGNANLVLCGHWHHAMADDRDGIAYRMLGPSGALPNRPLHPETGNAAQFGWLTLDETGYRFSILTSDAVSASDAFPYAMNQLEWKIENRAAVPFGFELDPKSPPSSGNFELVFTNVTNRPISTTVSFNEDNWRIRPAQRNVSLAAQKQERFRFAFSRKKNAPLFPGPRLKAAIPFFETTYVLQKDLAPTLSTRLNKSPATELIVDGDLGDPGWKTAASIGPFTEVRGAPMPYRTEVRAAVRRKVLYIGARLEERDFAPQPADRDASYIEDKDHFLILVDANVETPEYARFVIDPVGRLSKSRVSSSSESAELVVTAAAGRDENGWTVEAAIPLDQVGLGKDTRKIGFNVVRGRTRKNERSKAYWQPFSEHDRESLGRLRFSAKGRGNRL